MASPVGVWVQENIVCAEPDLEVRSVVDKSLRRRGILFAFFGMLGVSTDSFFIRLADVDGFDITLWVGIFTVITTFAASTFIHKVSPLRELRDGGWPLWLAAALQGSSTVFFVAAITRTSVANVVVIIAAAPMFAAAMSALFLGEKTSRRVWTAIGVVMIGVGIVVSGSFGGGSIFGDVLAIGAIFQFGCSLVLLRRFPEVNRTVMVGLAGLGMALVAVIPADPWGHEAKTWVALVLMGAIFGPVSRILLAVAPRYLPAAEVGLFTPVETVAASVWAWLFFDEAPILTTYIGGAVVLAAVFWGTTRPRTSVRP